MYRKCKNTNPTDVKAERRKREKRKQRKVFLSSSDFEVKNIVYGGLNVFIFEILQYSVLRIFFSRKTENGGKIKI